MPSEPLQTGVLIVALDTEINLELQSHNLSLDYSTAQEFHSSNDHGYSISSLAGDYDTSLSLCTSPDTVSVNDENQHTYYLVAPIYNLV